MGDGWKIHLRVEQLDEFDWCSLVLGILESQAGEQHF
jgi:hypothetical protein